MGIFRDLISNYAGTKIEEQRQKAQQQVQLGELMKLIWSDPKAKPEAKAAAQSFYLDLLSKHGGKKGREVAPQLAGLMSSMNAMQTMQNMAGNANTDDPGAPGQGPSAPVQGPTGAPGRINEPTGITGKGPRMTVDPKTGQLQPEARRGGPFRPVLSTLAGVGKRMAGVPPEQPDLASQLPAALRGGNWEMSDEEYAQLQGKTKGLEAAAQYEAEKPVEAAKDQRAVDQAKAVEQAKIDIDRLAAEGDRTSARKRLDGIQKLIPPEDYQRAVVEIETGVKLPTSRLPVNEQTLEWALEAKAKSLNKTVDQLTPQEKLDAQKEAKKAEEPPPIEAGSREFRVAQDLAYGRLTFQEFTRIYAYSRDASLREAIYDKARDLNPNFNPAAFEMGYKLASNPRVQQQLASLDNVQAGVPDLLKFSEAASRASVPLLNRFIAPGGIAIGSKTYSNFATARTAFADELSGALGYGSATDMAREMGFNMTDPTMSPEVFASNVRDVLVPFLERKRRSLTDRMGPYGGGATGATGGTSDAAGGGTTPVDKDPLGVLK